MTSKLDLILCNSKKRCNVSKNFNILSYLLQADSIKKSLKSGSGGSLDSKLQQVKELEEEVSSQLFLTMINYYCI